MGNFVFGIEEKEKEHDSNTCYYCQKDVNCECCGQYEPLDRCVDCDGGLCQSCGNYDKSGRHYCGKC